MQRTPTSKELQQEQEVTASVSPQITRSAHLAHIARERNRLHCPSQAITLAKEVF